MISESLTPKKHALKHLKPTSSVQEKLSFNGQDHIMHDFDHLACSSFCWKNTSKFGLIDPKTQLMY